jgi:hypothetical protein
MPASTNIRATPYTWLLMYHIRLETKSEVFVLE